MRFANYSNICVTCVTFLFCFHFILFIVISYRDYMSFYIDHLCYNETGGSYVGTASISDSGKPCLRWSSVTLVMSTSLRFHSMLGKPLNTISRKVLWCVVRCIQFKGNYCPRFSSRVSTLGMQSTILFWQIRPSVVLWLVRNYGISPEKFDPLKVTRCHRN